MRTVLTTAPDAARTAVDLVGPRRRDRRRGALVAAALVALVVAVALTALLVDTTLTPGQVVGAVLGTDDAGAFVVRTLRLPRLTLGLLIGAALGIAGALLQWTVRNPLASPDIVGLTQGASALAVLAIASGTVGAGVDLAAFVGAAGAALTIVALSGRGVTGYRFVVVGVAVAFLAQGVLGYALTRANLTEARSAFFWLVGSVGTAPWPEVGRVAAVLGTVVVVLVLGRRHLPLLALDDDTSRSVGGHPVAARAVAIGLSALLAASAVAVAGPLVFVAFLAGPIARGLRGRGPALVPAALTGAVVVALADVVAQHAVPGHLQPPAGLVTSVVGAPVLVWLLVRGERRKETPS